MEVGEEVVVVRKVMEEEVVVAEVVVGEVVAGEVQVKVQVEEKVGEANQVAGEAMVQIL